jgi:hypothetical protein
MCETKIQQDFIARTKKKHNKIDNKMYLKLVLNRLKVLKGPTYIYIHWRPNSRKPPWKLCPHVWPMTIRGPHVYPCGP